jgi:hypothetical protein
MHDACCPLTVWLFLMTAVQADRYSCTLTNTCNNLPSKKNHYLSRQLKPPPPHAAAAAAAAVVFVPLAHVFSAR